MKFIRKQKSFGMKNIPNYKVGRIHIRSATNQIHYKSFKNYVLKITYISDTMTERLLRLKKRQ